MLARIGLGDITPSHSIPSSLPHAHLPPTPCFVYAVCLESIAYNGATNPPEYTLVGANAGPTSTCGGLGCCVWAAVDHVSSSNGSAFQFRLRCRPPLTT